MNSSKPMPVPDGNTDLSLLPHDNLDRTLYAVNITLTLVSCIVVYMRGYGRMRILKRPLGWDDWCMIFAVLAACVLCVYHCLAVSAGVGKHLWDLTSAETSRVRPGKRGGPIPIVYVVTTGFIKCSIILQLLRLSPPPCRMRIVYHILLAIVVSAFVTGIAVFFVGNCLTTNVTGFTLNCVKRYWRTQVIVAIVGLITDVIVWLAPLRLIYIIRLPRGQKVALSISFGLGAAAWITAIVRLHFLLLSRGPEFSRDFTYLVTPFIICTAVEANLGIIFGSLPSLHPLLRRLSGIRKRRKKSNNGSEEEASTGVDVRLSQVELQTYQTIQ